MTFRFYGEALNRWLERRASTARPNKASATNKLYLPKQIPRFYGMTKQMPRVYATSKVYLRLDQTDTLLLRHDQTNALRLRREKAAHAGASRVNIQYWGSQCTMFV